MKSCSLASRTALVTGSSKGIGLAIAHGLHAAGAEVVFHGNTSRPGDLPAGCEFVQRDLLAPDGPAALVSAAFAAKPSLELLVCNSPDFRLDGFAAGEMPALRAEDSARANR